MLEKLDHIAEEVAKRLKKSKVSGKTITLKIKYSDFTLQTRSKTLPYFVSDKSIILETAKDLLYQEKMSNSVRLLGISLSNLNTEDSKKKKVEVRENPVIVQLRFEF
jgi:DNA polymerase-4